MQKLVINFIKNAKKSLFISETIKKYLKCPALMSITNVRTLGEVTIRWNVSMKDDEFE